MRRWRRRVAAAAIAASILGGAGFAYLASNTVPASSAGEGSGAVTITTTPGHYSITSTSFYVK